MNTYTDIFNEYCNQVFPSQEKYYDWYRESDSLRSAIKKAFLSEDLQKKVHPHQYRVGRQRLEQAAAIALEHFDAISDIHFDNFNQIHQFVQSVAAEVSGFGSLAVYDVALRIAKYQNCDLKEVHLHAGVTVGARAMGFEVKDGDILQVEQFPKPFKQLSGDHLENLLCIYKNRLADASAQGGKPCIR
ncbi:MAG: hypothetical protein F6J86_37195 [Symploca sp. SIO1B1]|nr:hypothetical protein [Symploca sp. SIO1A3]NER99394.1 hypothetical protein [Symploca sp. SIO1B1]